MSVIDCVTRLLDGHRLHDIKIEFSIMGESSSAYITAQDEAGIDIDVYYDDMKLIIKQSKISLNNRDQWEQLSRAVGWSKSIREIILKEKVEIHHSVVSVLMMMIGSIDTWAAKHTIVLRLSTEDWS